MGTQKNLLLSTLDLVIDSKQLYRIIVLLSAGVRFLDLLPKRAFFFIPRRYKLLVTSALFSEKLNYFSSRKTYWLDECFKHEEFKPYISMIRLKQEYLNAAEGKSIEQFVTRVWDKSKLNNEEIRNFLAWSAWNLGNNHWQVLIDKYLELARSQTMLKYKDKKQVQRILFPNFTPHMGHMAIAYLQHTKANYGRYREVQIKRLTPANDFYWNLVKHKSAENHVRISEVTDVLYQKDALVLDEYLDYDEFNQIKINFAIESGAKRSYLVELTNSSQSLSITEKDQIKGEDQLKRFVDNSAYRGIVALHIRGPKSNDMKHSQTRDADITTYLELCRAISNRGYLVVRMGDKSFPKLGSRFNEFAFDYAHSELKSDFMDCWLWSNMRFWIGNMNGVQYVARTFGKPILMTNQWYWNPQGSKSDLFLPKLLLGKKGIVDPIEIYESKISRSQSRKEIHRLGYKILENNSKLLAESAIEMIDNLENPTKIRNQKVHKLEKYFLRSCSYENRQDSMRLPNAFIEFLSSELKKK